MQKIIYRYAISQKSDVKSVKIRRMAFEMYLEGLRLRTISYRTVYRWIKNWDKQIELPIRNEQTEIAGLDDIHTYASKKTTTRYGLLLTDMEIGLSLFSVVTSQPKQA